MTPTEALIAALAKYRDSPSALANAIGGDVKRQNVEIWLKAGRVPPAQAPGIERATGGDITCEQLTGERARWIRVPDRKWPWHVRGRPALDVAKMAA